MAPSTARSACRFCGSVPRPPSCCATDMIPLLLSLLHRSIAAVNDDLSTAYSQGLTVVCAGLMTGVNRRELVEESNSQRVKKSGLGRARAEGRRCSRTHPASSSTFRFSDSSTARLFLLHHPHLDLGVHLAAEADGDLVQAQRLDGIGKVDLAVIHLH